MQRLQRFVDRRKQRDQSILVTELLAQVGHVIKQIVQQRASAEGRGWHAKNQFVECVRCNVAEPPGFILAVA
jgi:hypothetical protein